MNRELTLGQMASYVRETPAANARRVNKYKGDRCAVCGKWGAKIPFEQPIRILVEIADKTYGLTLKNPESNATHDKCLKQLKALIAQKRAEKQACLQIRNFISGR